MSSPAPSIDTGPEDEKSLIRTVSACTTEENVTAGEDCWMPVVFNKGPNFPQVRRRRGTTGPTDFGALTTRKRTAEAPAAGHATKALAADSDYAEPSGYVQDSNDADSAAQL